MSKESVKGKIIQMFKEGTSDAPSEKVDDEITRDMLMPKEIFSKYYSDTLASDSPNESHDCHSNLVDELALLREKIKTIECSYRFGVSTELADKRIEELGLRTYRTQCLIDKTKTE